MDLSSEPIVLDVFSEIEVWRIKQSGPNGESKYHWNNFHLFIVRGYFKNHFNSFDYRILPPAKLYSGTFLYTCLGISTVRRTYFIKWLKQFFVVPRLKKFLEIEYRVNKYQLVEAFLSFLLRLLYYKQDFAFGRIGDLEKELRFLHTVVGDTSVMRCGEQEEFEKLFSDFEAVANEAGSFVHFLLFSTHRAFKKSSKRLGVVLNQINLLKGNIMKFLNLQPFIMTCIPPKTSVVDSLLMVDSLIRDLEDLVQREDNRIAEAVDQFRSLHQGLISLQSSIKDFGSPHLSQIGELKEPLMQLGDLAREAEYLMVSCFNGEAPCWYLISRLTRVNNSIELIGAKIQEIMKIHKAGGLHKALSLFAQSF